MSHSIPRSAPPAPPRLSALLALLLLLLVMGPLAAQTPAPITLSGQVLDPTGALVPSAKITLTGGGNTFTSASGADGSYRLSDVSPGSYQLTVDAAGFSRLVVNNLRLTASRHLDLPLRAVTDTQQVTVTTNSSGLSVSNSDNINTTVIEGADLDALSDDPDQLRNELMALAGPAAGPDGGQIYIDGFTSNQLPPKSSILQVRVNQDPFSAENDRIGYGRIDIITRPSAAKFAGHARFSFVSSALDSSNPLISTQPGYFYYSFSGDATGRLAKNSSWLGAAQYWQRQRQAIVNAVDPANTSARIAAAFPSPYSTFNLYARADTQFGNHVLSLFDSFLRTRTTGGGVGGIVLPQQGFSNTTYDNNLVLRDFAVLSPTLVNELGLLWERGRDDQMPDSLAPAVSVQGSFATGGSSAGRSADHESFIELHDYMTLTRGYHVFRFGVRMRSFHDASLSTAGANGAYTFSSIAQYQAGTPSQYSVTLVRTPTVRVTTFDAHLFFQDEWRARPNLSIGYGLRLQGQSRNRHPLDLAPRIALTWAPGNDGHSAPRFALHAGFGLFYSSLGLGNILQTIRQNGYSQQSYIAQDPGFYEPGMTVPPTGLPSSSSTIYTLAPSFHTAMSLQAGAGFDRALGKATAINVSYLFTQGSHQFFTDLVTAPAFDPATYTTSGPAPDTYNFQLQSGGLFREHQLIFTARTRMRFLSLSGTYTFSHARGNTSGAGSVPFDSRNLSLDYGRTGFDIAHRLQAVGTITLPARISANLIAYVQSGSPFNITTGADLAGNTRYNSRPTYGACGSPGVVSTSFGCLDTQPTGKSEPIVPINLGTGPINRIVNLTLTKNVGVGPRLHVPERTDEVAAAATAAQNSGGLRPGQVGPTAAAAPKAPRRFTLGLTAGINNLLNSVNYAAPNGVLSSPLFGQSQTLAGGPFTSPAPGNRVFYLNSSLTF